MLSALPPETLSTMLTSLGAAQAKANVAVALPDSDRPSIEATLVEEFRKILEAQLPTAVSATEEAPVPPAAPWESQMSDLRSQMENMMTMIKTGLGAGTGAAAKEEGGKEEAETTKVVSTGSTDARTASMKCLMEKLLKDPLVERRGVTSMGKFDGTPEKYKGWRFTTKALFDREVWMRALISAVEAKALQKDRKKIDLQNTTLEFTDPTCGQTVTMRPSDWASPKEEVHHLVIALSENVYQVLQVLLEGTAALTVQNMESEGPSRGFETWAHLHRDHFGENGPRVLSMCDAVFYPPKSKMEDLTTAVATHEAAVKRLMAGDVKAILQLMTIYGLKKVVPDELSLDYAKEVDKFELDYSLAQRWVLDQVVLRKKVKETGGRNLNQLEEGGGDSQSETAGAAEKALEEFRELSPAAQEDQYTELLWFSKGKGKGKGHQGGNASGTFSFTGTFQGECGYCGHYGHMKKHCRKLDAAMREFRAGGEKGSKGAGKSQAPQYGAPNFKGKGGGKKGSYTPGHPLGGKGGG